MNNGADAPPTQHAVQHVTWHVMKGSSFLDAPAEANNGECSTFLHCCTPCVFAA